MGSEGRKSRRLRAVTAGMVVALATAGSAAAALQALPPGAQVNDDPAAGIDKAISVSGQDPTNADVVGGTLTAGKPAGPWAIFRQQEAAGSKDQAFVRSFAAGAWTTRGNGTVGGRSSANPQFRGSLNFDQGQDAEAPAIDFAGAGRTVPWATWYENATGTGFGANNIFASRFDNSGGPSQGKWIFASQSRGTGGGSVPVPSLNIHTDQAAENPSVAGGSAVDPTKPGPWVTWQETTTSPVNGADQIFASRPIGPGATNCDNVTPAGVADATGHVPAIGGFCFQQTGIPRVGPGNADPSLNVDPTRNGVEPDIAFTGKNAAAVQDGVPWVVWYEKGNTNSAVSGLTHNNEMVFAAKGISDGVAAHGGFGWTAVGSQTSALLDASQTNHFGGCAASDSAEAGCSLNKNPNVDAEDPQVAAGTMNPANPTSPWVTWDEDVNGVKQVFVSRLVGTGTAAHFELVNNGAPISIGANNSTRPDITFSQNTPYVSWREDIGGGIERAFTGHFVNAANPTFVLDNSDVLLTPTGQADVREPISSSCIATPFNQDGSACQGAAIGTLFFLYTNGTSPRGLFADAYAPDAPITGPASAVGTGSATLTGVDNPQGASVSASFQYGATTAYGQSTAPQTLAPSNGPTTFSAQLTGLAAGTTIHYRAVITTDFGTFVGTDRTLRTGSPTPPPPGSGHASVGHAKASANNAIARASCAGASGATCKLTLSLTATETFRDHRLITVTARKRAGKIHRVVVIGSTQVTLTAGQTRSVRIGLNRRGRRLLAHHDPLKATLRVTQRLADGHVVRVSTQKVVFKEAKRHHHR
jgi:hypothetical protein